MPIFATASKEVSQLYGASIAGRLFLPVVFYEYSIPEKQPFMGSVRKAGCVHAHSFISLKRKKGMSETPLN